MRPTARQVRLVALPVVGLGLVAALFFSCYERREVEEPVGRSREAIRNPYLALGRLLERMGHEVVTIEGAGRLVELPPTGATLVLPVPRRSLGPVRSQRLLEWVAEGGHLIVVSHSPWDDPDRTPDPLLDPLGFRHHREDPELPFSEPELPAPDEEEDDEPVPPPTLREVIDAALNPPIDWDETEAHWPGREEPLRVRFERSAWWGDEHARARWAVAGTRGAHLLQTGYGAGLVSALTDDHFLRNQNIGWGDHGELAVRLARAEGRLAPVWIVISEDWPGLAAVLREHATPALVSALVLAIAWLARVIPRFGPLRPGPAPERRRWMEHLEAVGRFHWRDDRGAALLAGMRGSLLRELERRRPEWAALEPRARARELAGVAGLAPERAERALDGSALAASEEAFVTLVDDLERIRAVL